MGKLRSNVLALIKGSTYLLKSNIGKGLRVFKGAELRLYKTSTFSIGTRLKIDKNSMVVACDNSELIIGDNVGIGPGNHVVCRERIQIGPGTITGPNVMIYDHNHLFSAEEGVDRYNYKTGSIYIGANCWIGANTVILKGAHIGDNCVIGAGSIINSDIPDGILVVQKRHNELITIGE